MVRDTSVRLGNPNAAATLTSVSPDASRWSKDTEQVVRALRRRWGAMEYLAFMEWTTGKSPSSGGIRRPHAHLLVRGLNPEEATEAEEIARRTWLRRTGAHRVEVAPLRAADDGSAYLALHHLKPNQAPPSGWTGRRLRPSKGWWGQNARELRQEATQRVAERAHAARVAEDRKRYLADLEHAGVPVEIAADLAAARPAPARQRARVVRLMNVPR